MLSAQGRLAPISGFVKHMSAAQTISLTTTWESLLPCTSILPPASPVRFETPLGTPLLCFGSRLPAGPCHVQIQCGVKNVVEAKTRFPPRQAETRKFGASPSPRRCANDFDALVKRGLTHWRGPGLWSGGEGHSPAGALQLWKEQADHNNQEERNPDYLGV